MISRVLIEIALYRSVIYFLRFVYIRLYSWVIMRHAIHHLRQDEVQVLKSNLKVIKIRFFFLIKDRIIKYFLIVSYVYKD